MLIKADNSDKNKILDYLRDNIEECIYLFIDISNYSIESDTCEVRYNEEQGSIDYVIMRYYNSYQVFSKKAGYLPKEVCDYVNDNPVMMISGRKDLIEALAGNTSNYKATYGYVFELNRRVATAKNNTMTMWADINDADEIADLIQTDSDIGAHYTKETLVKQLVDRMESKTGRSCIMRENGKIVAHTATYAENNQVAVISGTVVHPDYRSSNYFLQITTALQGMLAEEGKKSYTFSVSEKMINYHRRLHRTCGEYGKLERIDLE